MSQRGLRRPSSAAGTVPPVNASDPGGTCHALHRNAPGPVGPVPPHEQPPGAPPAPPEGPPRPPPDRPARHQHLARRMVEAPSRKGEAPHTGGASHPGGAASRLRGRLRELLVPEVTDLEVVGEAPTVPLATLFRRFWPDARPYRKWLVVLVGIAALLPAVE